MIYIQLTFNPSNLMKNGVLLGCQLYPNGNILVVGKIVDGISKMVLGVHSLSDDLLVKMLLDLHDRLNLHIPVKNYWTCWIQIITLENFRGMHGFLASPLIFDVNAVISFSLVLDQVCMVGVQILDIPRRYPRDRRS
jgi:hypothetical protein